MKPEAIYDNRYFFKANSDTLVRFDFEPDENYRIERVSETKTGEMLVFHPLQPVVFFSGKEAQVLSHFKLRKIIYPDPIEPRYDLEEVIIQANLNL